MIQYQSTARYSSLSSSPPVAVRVLFALLFTLGPALPAAHGYDVKDRYSELVINEIMKDPASVSDTHGEYVEIYNPNRFDVDLNLWAIRDNGSDYHLLESPDPLIVEPFGYFVLARDSSSVENGGFTADYEYSSFTLSNSSDDVILVNPAGYTVDSVSYDSADFPGVSGRSLELRNEGFDNAMWFSWDSAVTPYGMGDSGTPGSRNSTWENYKEVTLDPECDSLDVIIGGSMQLGYWMASQTDEPIDVHVSGDIWLPDGSPHPNNPVFGPVGLWFEPGELKEKNLEMFVPLRVEPGEYTLVGHVQDGHGDDIDTAEVVIRVTAGEKVGEDRAQSRETPASDPGTITAAVFGKFEGE